MERREELRFGNKMQVRGEKMTTTAKKKKKRGEERRRSAGND
jgi:hypothetical protein